MTGAALLHALAQVMPQNGQNASGGSTTTPEPASRQTTMATAPRRSTEEDEDALQRAAATLREQIQNLRQDSDGDHSAAAHLAADALLVTLRPRTVLLVPDDGPSLVAPAPAESLRSRLVANPASPRAPPLA